MEEKIIGVRFRKTGKLHYFDSLNYTFKLGDNVIATTERGEELGRVVKLLSRSNLGSDIQIDKIQRPASKKDIERFRENEEKSKEVLEFCKEQVIKLELNMKVLLAEYTFDESKLTIYFVSEDRVDFRDLVKILASRYKTRIELRQIGPRDEIKSYPNLGMCGKEVCCRTYLQDFEPVTIKMAKEQGLQINMAKLSGACGKLMCCLKHEEKTYKDNLKRLPKVGTIVTVDGQDGKVTSIDIIGLKVKVKFGNTREEERYETYPVEKIKWNIKEEKE